MIEEILFWTLLGSVTLGIPILCGVLLYRIFKSTSEIDLFSLFKRP